MESAAIASSSPVGSSASSSGGLLARATAIETRCCSPPESCSAWCSARFSRSTAQISSDARWLAAFADMPFKSSGISTFWIALK